jgi:hypothetical protein
VDATGRPARRVLPAGLVAAGLLPAAWLSRGWLLLGRLGAGWLLAGRRFRRVRLPCWLVARLLAGR